MKKLSASLDNVRVASPCTARWDQMEGDDRSRFCSECKLSVYNLSAMTRAEAAEFVSAAEGRVCIRYYQRADGTMLTTDCPVGVQAARMRFTRRVRSAAAAVLTLVAGGTGINSARAGGSPKMGKMMAPVVQTQPPADTVRKADTAVVLSESLPVNDVVGADTVPLPVDQATEPTPPEEMGHYVMGGMIAPMHEIEPESNVNQTPVPVDTVTVRESNASNDAVIVNVDKPVEYNGPAVAVEQPEIEVLVQSVDVVYTQPDIKDSIDDTLVNESEVAVEEPETVVVATNAVQPEPEVVTEPETVVPEAAQPLSRIE